MLSDKEILLLCEVSNLSVISKEFQNGIVTVAECMAKYLHREEGIKIIKEVLSSNHLSDLFLKEHVVQGHRSLLVFTDAESNSVVVAIEQDEETGFLSRPRNMDSALTIIEKHRYLGNCMLTGYKRGGVYASELAQVLDMEIKVFGAPSTEELPGRVTNYIAENDFVGSYSDKIIFVQQNSNWQDHHDFYYESLGFDEKGNMVAASQSDFSKFTSWFYHTVGTVQHEIWEMLFKDSGEVELPLDQGILSVYLKINELNVDVVQRFIDDVIKYAENEVERNRNLLKLEIKKIEIIEFQLQLDDLVESYTNKTVDINNKIYQSVETILMGMGLFTLERNTIHVEPLMEKFNSEMNLLLSKESEKLIETVKNEAESNFNEMIKFTNIVMNGRE